VERLLFRTSSFHEAGTDFWREHGDDVDDNLELGAEIWDRC
jgi:hypothetical protein